MDILLAEGFFAVMFLRIFFCVRVCVCVCSLGKEKTFISKGWDQNHKMRKFYKIVLLAAQHASEKLSGFGVITLRNSEIASMELFFFKVRTFLYFYHLHKDVSDLSSVAFVTY